MATATNTALLVGAVGLLVASANRPGLRAVSGVLIVIELLAFLRSPIRFNERLGSHQLGFRAVTRWRSWLMETVGYWGFSRGRTYGSGDLLERSLTDSDELQDLWLRCVIPLFSVVLVAILGDLFIGLLPSHSSWWPFAVLLGLVQVLALGALWGAMTPVLRADQALRIARSVYTSSLVELSAVTPELELLGAHDFLEQRSLATRDALERCERALHRRSRLFGLIILIASVVALTALAGTYPRTSPTWIAVAAMVALSTFEALRTVRQALETAIAISGAAQRLEDLESPRPGGDRPWPHDSNLLIKGLNLREAATVLLANGTLKVGAGRRVAITGPSGSGKSTLLRVLAALEDHEGGSILVGSTALKDIEEQVLRQHLAYVPAEPGLTRGFASDVVKMGRTGTRDVLHDLTLLDLPVEATTKWEEHSRGERARIAFIRALFADPDLFVLDEPTSALGQEQTRRILELLEERGASVVVATHDPPGHGLVPRRPLSRGRETSP